GALADAGAGSSSAIGSEGRSFAGSGLAWPAAGWTGLSIARMYPPLRCFVASMWEYQCLPAGAGEFGSARHSSTLPLIASALPLIASALPLVASSLPFIASALPLIAGATLALHAISPATSAIDPIGLGICPDMMPPVQVTPPT